MNQVTSVLASKVVVIVLVLCGLVALTGSRLRRRLRVSPAQVRSAPLLWLVALTPDARLHRRIRSTARRVREALRARTRQRPNATLSPAQRLARDLDDELIALDDRLIGAHQMTHDANRRAVKTLRAELERIDALVPRIERLLAADAAPANASTVGGGIDDLRARLERLEAARSDDAPIDVPVHGAAGSDPAPASQGAITTTASPTDPAGDRP